MLGRCKSLCALIKARYGCTHLRCCNKRISNKEYSQKMLSLCCFFHIKNIHASRSHITYPKSITGIKREKLEQHRVGVSRVTVEHHWLRLPSQGNCAYLSREH